MADFQFYLNRQGIRGLQGVKGDQGDSPIITVQTETPNEYILKITNPDGTELISPNLRGNKININEGTYVRYNTETGELYTSTVDGATGELAGVVRLATEADITDMDERAVVTPSQLADALSQYLVSPDGSVKIVQNAENSLTELTVESAGKDIVQLKSDVSTLQNEVSVLNTEIDTKSPKLAEGENITLTPQDDGTIKIDSTGGLTELPIASANTLGAVKIGENLSITEDGVLSSTASGDVSGSGDNTFTGTNDFNGVVNLNGITTAENITVARNLTSSGEINAVSIKSTGIRSDDIETTTNKKYLTEEDVDNSTIQVVDGKLTANDSNYIKTSQVSKDGIDSGIYLNRFNGNKLTTIQPKFNALDGALGIDSFSYLKAATYSASEPADEDMVNNWTNENGFLTGSTTSTGFISGSAKFVAGSGSLQVVFKLMEAGYIAGIDQNGDYKFSKIEISMDGTTYTEYNNTTSNAKYIRFTFDYNFTSMTYAEFSTRIRTTASNIAGGHSVPLFVKVDNQTIQIVDDKLHANFDEINGEVNDVSVRVTALEGQVGDVSAVLDNINGEVI